MTPPLLACALAFAFGLTVGLVLLFWEKVRLSKEIAKLEGALSSSEKNLEWSDEKETQMSNTFKALAGDALRSNSENLISRSKDNLESLVKPLKESLIKLDNNVKYMEEKRHIEYGNLENSLQHLDTTTTDLAAVLSSSSKRGRWGEIQLQRLVEMAGMAKHVDFKEQEATDTGRPDMTVHYPNGRVLPIDSKVPLDAYQEAVNETDDDRRSEKLASHALAMKNHMRTLANKEYWNQLKETPDFVVMFVPIEASLTAAFEKDSELFQNAMDKKVLICSPTNLFALLKAVALGWQEKDVTENAVAIRKLGDHMYARIKNVVDHIKNMGESLESSVNSYNQLIGSLESRLVPAARQFRKLGVGTDDIVESPETIDTQPRQMHLPDELETDEGDC